MTIKATALAAFALLMTSQIAIGQDKAAQHKVAVQVNQDDPKVMNLALNNVQNIYAYYKKKGETVAVEVVAYGPGLHMFRDDTSPVKARLSKMALEEPTLKFAACGNTLEKQRAAAKTDIKLVSEAKLVASGVITLLELQEQGYSYIRP